MLYLIIIIHDQKYMYTISSKSRPHFVTFLLGVKESLSIINLIEQDCD